jgi:excisionase family DNA binding protein
MSAFDDAARDMANLVQRVADLENQVKSLLARREGLARTAYKPSEVAAMLGKNPATIREWIKDGRLPAEDMGGWYAVPASAVEAISRRSA